MRRSWMAGLAILALAAVPVLAGPEGSKKCTEPTQACLDKMVAKLKNRGWLGIEMDDSKGAGEMRITRVIAGSPAEAAGFKTGDTLVSLNGVRFADNTEEKCATCEAAKDWTPGTQVAYVVRRDGKDVPMKATLATLPPDVLAQWVGMHLLEHAHPEEVASK